ncbi:class I SAM-dependent methyltransferase [Cellvibrio sp. pealriver]|uniref:class I SAM-dependent methyltransferase n=1 Tax=Cellvibrio sp. pealriver TaxID=1622269 RepID=UPI00066FD902|nr:class I SAM-dependent methyltransferase [Cellvibrio sp. pealriver]
MSCSSNIAILCNDLSLDSARAAWVESLASQLQIPLLRDQSPDLITSAEFVLLVDDVRVVLQQTGRKAPGPILVEFTEGSVDHRRKFGGGKGQMIAKAVGIKSGCYPRVLDATAGLGKDSFVLASLGCPVTLLERSPVVQILLQDGLMRALAFAREHDPELLVVLQRMQLITQDSGAYLASLDTSAFPDVIYLDPMFPERNKSADVKKEMAAFHDVVGKDEDADSLLPLALEHVNYRVVVKRPRKAPFLNNQTPSYQLEGKSSRYDIYTIKKLPDHLNN